MNTKPSNPKDMVGIRKAPLSCLPMNVVAEMGVAMLEGANKYGRHNYRAVGVRTSVYFDAVMRHVISFWEGEDIDPDSGLPHMTKAMVSLAVLRDAQMRGIAIDDRPPTSKPFYPALNEKAGQLIDKHSDKSPKHYTIEDSVTNYETKPPLGAPPPWATPSVTVSKEDLIEKSIYEQIRNSVLNKDAGHPRFGTP